MKLFLLLFLATFCVTMWGRRRYQRVYDEELKNTISSHITGAELARRIVDSSGIQDVEVVKGRGILCDFYDPATRRLVLAPQHYAGSTFSGLGVAAHEAGHVIQHFEGHRPLLWRISAIKASVFLSLPVMVVGVIMILTGLRTPGFLLLTLFWPLLALFNFLTLPTELDASVRAKQRLDNLKVFRNLDERLGVERVMNAASAYYLDGLFVALSRIREFLPNLLK